jgi:hypothetical protein
MSTPCSTCSRTRSVVQRLAVVGVGTGLEQQAGQRGRVRVPRLTHWTELTLAEDAGQYGKRSRQAVPEVTGVRVGAGLEQEPGGAEHGSLADTGIVAGVGQVEQRLPPVRAARPASRTRIAGQVRGEPGLVRGGRRGVDAELGDLRVPGEDLAGLGPAFRLVVFVAQAGQGQEPVGRAGRGGIGHPGGKPAVALDHLDVPA